MVKTQKKQPLRINSFTLPAHSINDLIGAGYLKKYQKTCIKSILAVLIPHGHSLDAVLDLFPALGRALGVGISLVTLAQLKENCGTLAISQFSLGTRVVHAEIIDFFRRALGQEVIVYTVSKPTSIFKLLTAAD